MENSVINLGDALNEKLRMRYAEDSILPGYHDNVIVRQYFVRPERFSDEDLKRMRFMNPNLIKMDSRLFLNQDQSQTYAPDHFTNALMRHILTELNIMPTAEDLQVIKDKKIKMAVIGYGGAMINVLYNLTLWQHELSVNGIFERLFIFEQDNIEFTNLMRLGKEVVSEYHPKVPGIESTVTALPKLMLVREERELVNQMRPNLINRWMTAEDAEFLKEKGYIFMGAPTFEARAFLGDKNFYFIGHGGNEVDITLAPEVNMSLGNETYGTIDIPVLIMNLHIATAKLIKHLASGEEVPFNTNLFRFDLGNYIRNNPELAHELAIKQYEEVA